MMKLSLSEKHITQLFQSRYQIDLEKINEHGGQKGKTPDFEYREKGKPVFVCELKNLQNIRPSEETGWEIKKHSDTFTSFSRISNAINRVSDAIYHAHKQLEHYDTSKILIILNQNWNLGVDNLEETIKGYRVLGNDDNGTHIDNYARRASEGKIKNIKMNIDLYVWVDTDTHKYDTEVSEDTTMDKVYFRYATKQGQNILQKYFLNSTE
jgi:hypothetical protein